MTSTHSQIMSLALVALLALSACAKKSDATSAKNPSAEDKATCLFDIAEAFENLTEKASAADTQELARLSDEAESGARACSASLSGTNAKALESRLGAVRDALRSNDRAGVARNAVEIYRIFVTAEARGPKDAPLQVSLLDYAGFRIQSDLQATPPDWADAESALLFAEQQWSEIEATISDRNLKKSFAADLERISAAMNDRNVAAAKDAVRIELDGVDLLERYYTKS